MLIGRSAVALDYLFPDKPLRFQGSYHIQELRFIYRERKRTRKRLFLWYLFPHNIDFHLMRVHFRPNINVFLLPTCKMILLIKQCFYRCVVIWHFIKKNVGFFTFKWCISSISVRKIFISLTSVLSEAKFSKAVFCFNLVLISHEFPDLNFLLNGMGTA